MTGWYDFSNVKSSKMLSFRSVAEANGLIYPRPSDENFSFACSYMIYAKICRCDELYKFLNGLDTQSIL